MIDDNYWKLVIENIFTNTQPNLSADLCKPPP